MTGTHETTINVGDHRIAHRQSGSGPDLLFLHGWPLHGGTWRNIVPRLESTYTCHVIDLPGTGNTVSAPGAHLALDANTAVVLDVISQLGLDRFSLIGNDSGGLLAREIAAERSGDVEALVITGSEIPGHVPAQIPRLKKLVTLPGSAPIMSIMLRNRWLRRSPLGLTDCFADMAASDGDFAAAMLDPLKDRQAIVNQIELLRTFDPGHVDGLFDVHPKITAPTLMIWGERDPYFPVARARAMAKQFGGPVTFEVIANAKLFVHEEFPERFAALTSDFLQSLPLTASPGSR